MTFSQRQHIKSTHLEVNSIYFLQTGFLSTLPWFMILSLMIFLLCYCDNLRSVFPSVAESPLFLWASAFFSACCLVNTPPEPARKTIFYTHLSRPFPCRGCPSSVASFHTLPHRCTLLCSPHYRWGDLNLGVAPAAWVGGKGWR